MGKRIIFCHIPKTAGTSIKQAFQKTRMVILDSFNFIDYARMNYNFCITKPNKNSEPIVFIQIHEWTPWNMFEGVHPQPNDFMFTIIRHPISMFYSIYYHIKRTIKDLEITNEKKYKFNVVALVHNMINTSRNIEEYIDWILDFGFVIQDKILPKGYFEEKTLNRMDFVGLFEELEASIRHVLRQADLNIKIELEPANVHDYNHNQSYRYDELSNFFKDEIAIYDLYKHKFSKIFST